MEHDRPHVQVAAELHGTQLFLPIHASGSAPLWMLLDPGAELTVLDLGAARELGVGVSGFRGITGFGADTLRGGVTEGGIAIGLPGTVPYHLHRPVLDLGGWRRASAGGRPASDLSLPDIRNLLRRTEEGELSLVLKRGAENLTLRVLLVPRI